MKIVILDAYTENPGDLSWKALEQFGELTVYDRTPMNDEVEIIRRINYAEIVLTNKTPINARVIDACPSMKFISVLATGYNIVDYKYAAKKGITVSNVPAYGTASVAYKLYDSCNGEKQLYIVHGADHSENYRKDPGGYEKIVTKFIEERIERKDAGIIEVSIRNAQVTLSQLRH